MYTYDALCLLVCKGSFGYSNDSSFVHTSHGIIFLPASGLVYLYHFCMLYQLLCIYISSNLHIHVVCL